MTNIFVILGSGICVLSDQLDDRTTSLVFLIIGRFVFGFACGSFSVFCPKYIAETSPLEIKGKKLLIILFQNLLIEIYLKD